MSSSKALAASMFAGLRVAGETIYVPESVRNDGKEVGQRCIIPVYQNTGRDDAQGKSIANVYKLTAWNGLADVMAKSCPKGKEFHAICSPRSYPGRVWYGDRTPVMDKDGTFLMTTKIGFNIEELSLGSDSYDFLTKEIERGARGVQWQVPGTQDHANWLARVASVKALKYQPGVGPDGKLLMERFGYARIEIYGTDTTGPVVDATKNVQNTFTGAVEGNQNIDKTAYDAAAAMAALNKSGYQVVNGEVVPIVANGGTTVNTAGVNAAPLF